MNAIEKAQEIRNREAKWGQHTTAKSRLQLARYELRDVPGPELDWRDGHGYPCLALATFEQAPFMVTVTIEHDDCPDLSWVGKFSQNWEDGAIEVELDEEYDPGRHGFRYFIPANPEYRNLDWRMMKQIIRDDMLPCGVRAVASKNGHDLGQASIWGCFLEGDKYDEVAQDCLSDIIEEAVEEAELTLSELCLMS